MKKITQTVVLLFFISSISAQAPNNTVNPVIGDESFIELFGILPDKNTDEQLRIQAHLAYVEYKLRERSVDGLNEQQKANREMVLNLLHDYWANGVFPSNYDYPGERRPCFIDRNANICAVGYLVEKTAGIELARQINEKHQYDYLMDMNEPVLAEWAGEHGFTLEECAMIQPQYPGWPLPGAQDPVTIQKPIDAGYGISSGLVGGFNLAVTTVNLSGRPGNVKTMSYIGLVTGTSQILMGIASIRSDRTLGRINDAPEQTLTYKAQNNLSYVNIALGTTTIVTSAINLYLNRKVKDKRNSVGLYSYPGLNNEMNVGFSFARRL